MKRWVQIMGLVGVVFAAGETRAGAGEPSCNPTDDPIALGVRAQLKRCADVERGKVGDLRSVTVYVDAAKAVSVIDVLDANANLLRLSTPRRELSPAGNNRWSQHAPDDPSIVADVGCEPRFENRAVVEADQPSPSSSPSSSSPLRIRFELVENVNDALSKRRIAESAARDAALRAAKDLGDDSPSVTRGRLYLTRRDCRRDPRARLVYRMGTKDEHGRRVTDVDATSGEIVATHWSDGKTKSEAGQ